MRQEVGETGQNRGELNEKLHQLSINIRCMANYAVCSLSSRSSLDLSSIVALLVCVVS